MIYCFGKLLVCYRQMELTEEHCQLWTLKTNIASECLMPFIFTLIAKFMITWFDLFHINLVACRTLFPRQNRMKFTELQIFSYLQELGKIAFQKSRQGFRSWKVNQKADQKYGFQIDSSFSEH